METHPLRSLSQAEAVRLQFKIVDAVTRNFDGLEVLNLGDLGVRAGGNKPLYTEKAERVFADVFDAEAALLVRGAGTGAIRWALSAAARPGDTILIHSAPIYPTTETSIQTLGLSVITADFNDPGEIRRITEENRSLIRGILLQHTRQSPEDFYDFQETTALLKECLPEAALITDDNYAALKVERIGCQAGADISTFSCFKILGPEGVGVLLGKKQWIEKIQRLQYSGGSQVQGHEAMEALRGLIYAPVSFAIQAQVAEELVRRLNNGEVKGVKGAFVANAQSKVALVEFEEDLAELFLALSPKYGAAAHPVGSESKYEFAPMIYRISGTFRQKDPALGKRMIRVNPMRAGADTILRIIRSVLEEVRGRS